MTLLQGKIPLSIMIVIVAAATGEICAGINSVLFPVTLESFGLSNSMIGLILSVEVAAVVFLSPFIGTIIGHLGLFWATIAGTIGRAAILMLLINTNNVLLWVLLLFLFGICSTILAIALQTWVNFAKLPGVRGFVVSIYSASMAIGIALGPVILQFIGGNRSLAFTTSAVVTLLAMIPIFFIRASIPEFEVNDKPRLLFVIRNGKYVMFSAVVGGISFYGLPAFLTLYGMEAGLSMEQASLLITMFMLGGLILGPAIGYFSDRFERTQVILVSFLVSLLCSVFLPITIFELLAAYALLFVWGGAMEGVSSGGMTMLAELYRKEDQVSANIAYQLMDALGGTMGVMLIGLAMDWHGSEGLVYVIVGAAVIYFNFALTQYKVE
ncbi:MAG TPA: MFS transporter [Candidatus Rifleibacterium sp.]|nr:MFS transporter [Candidatus Rifleibacterium sp.]HPT47648.1 MFS transporter [Candidatus Rifleibacterium sp.]